MRDLEQSFQFLRDENFQLVSKRDHVNSLDPLDKNKLLKMFLSIEKRLSVETRVNCLPIFLDNRSKYFGFIQEIWLTRSTKWTHYLVHFRNHIKSHRSTIETIDFRSLSIRTDDIEQLKCYGLESMSPVRASLGSGLSALAPISVARQWR